MNKLQPKVQDTRSQYINPGNKCRLYSAYVNVMPNGKLMVLDDNHRNTCDSCNSIHEQYPDRIMIVEHDYMPKRRSLRE